MEGCPTLREISHNGGIYNTFEPELYDMQVKTVHTGSAQGQRQSHDGVGSGPETLATRRWAPTRYDRQD